MSPASVLFPPTCSMPMPRTVLLQDLGTAIDELHAQFGEWGGGSPISPPLDDFGVEVLKFAVHEWVANLVQHADFPSGHPTIRVSLDISDDEVHCTIEDNSRGFDFDVQVEQQRAAVTAPTPPERGRGLLMLIACTEGLRYYVPGYAGTPGDSRHRLEFSISASDRPWIDVPF